MYKLKRNSNITEMLKLGKEKIRISLDAFKVTREFRSRYNDLAKAEKAAAAAVGSNNSEDIFEAYGNAIFSIMDLCFGEENRKKIVAFYEDNYIEMTQVIIPYITDKLLPKVLKAVNEQRDMLARKYSGK